jgi:hypothetical protein
MQYRTVALLGDSLIQKISDLSPQLDSSSIGRKNYCKSLITNTSARPDVGFTLLAGSTRS